MATIAHEYRRLLEAYADLTGADAAFIDWQAHDFSARGLSGPEDSMRAGFAHLCSFTGTDTVAAIDYAEQYYGADSDRELVGGSVPATEHSVMSMGGKLDEIGTFRRLITEVYPSGIVSIVSDTWDFWQVITEYAATLKDEILARAPNALGQGGVPPGFRRSGQDPDGLSAGRAGGRCRRGRHVHRQGHGRQDHRGRAQGRRGMPVGPLRRRPDRQGLSRAASARGPDLRRLDHAEPRRADPGTPADQGLCLDQLRVRRGLLQLSIPDPRQLRHGHEGHLGHGQWRGARAVQDPKTDSGTKKSAVGLLRVEREGGDYVLHDRQTPEQEAGGLLQDVFVDGKLVREHTLAEIRARLRNGG